MLPQVDRAVSRMVVLRVLPGCIVAFCSVISQDIGSMMEQLSLLGQQSSVVFCAR